MWSLKTYINSYRLQRKRLTNRLAQKTGNRTAVCSLQKERVLTWRIRGVWVIKWTGHGHICNLTLSVPNRQTLQVKEREKKRTNLFRLLSFFLLGESSTLVGKKRKIIIASPQPHYRLSWATPRYNYLFTPQSPPSFELILLSIPVIFLLFRVFPSCFF